MVREEERIVLMAVIAVLIGCSFIIAVGFLIAFLWSVRSGQYEDKYTPSVRILFDDNNNTLSSHK